MDAATYTVTGTGPSGGTFTETAEIEQVTKSGLVVGSWTIVVNALNSSGTLIGTGTATAEVVAGETAQVSVTISPISGTGTLSLAATWTVSQVQNPSITATLTPALGTAQNLPFAVSGGSASYSSSAIGDGYYTLTLTLNDNGTPVAGAVEVVRVVAGATTNGTYDFPNVNAPGSSIQVNINTQMRDPLLVSIAGGGALMVAGNTTMFTASVLNYTDNLTYVWYVNGSSVGLGSSYTFGSGIPLGNYRIDVTAFSADGSRAGSSTKTVQVTSSIPPASNWIPRTLPSNAYWSSVTYGNGVFVAVSGQASNKAASSPDGITWTARTLPETGYWDAIAYGNGIFLTAGGNKVATSTDGITWATRTVPVYMSMLSLAFGNGVFIVIDQNHAVTSSDGITWTEGGTLPSSSGQGYVVTFGNGRFLAIDKGGTLALTSADGLTWTEGLLPSGTSNRWNSVVYGNGVFLAVGYSAATSADGVTWTSRTIPNFGNVSTATYGNGVFVALPTLSTDAAISPDGITWMKRSIPISYEWRTIAFGNGIFVAVANGFRNVAMSSE
jgi:hypothetical protein